MYVKLELAHTGIEEHVPHGGSLLVHFERVASENDALRDDAGGIGIHERPHRYNLWCCM